MHSLYHNINKRKKAGTSRSKSKSTIDPKIYKKMKDKKGTFAMTGKNTKKDRKYKKILESRDKRFDKDNKGNLQGFQTRVSQKDKLLSERREKDKGTKDYYDTFNTDEDTRNLSNPSYWNKMKADYLVDETRAVMKERRLRKLRNKNKSNALKFAKPKRKTTYAMMYKKKYK
tara:strand:- start:2137 stop:2652 length:516 start_codon:yes stop_codon:yes gene_type:complete